MSPEIQAVPGAEKIGNRAILTEEDVRAGWFYLFVKRLFDIFFSFLALAVLIVPFAIISLIIFIDDPHGGPFYSQERVGKDGRTFKFWKFRSMVVNADDLREQLECRNEKDGPVFKIKDDPRITRFGRILRKCSIDEMPQFWNVLKGDMSIVGPRPALPNEVETYDAYQRQRLLITPGLTCYWQVSKCRDDISFDEWVDMDLAYIRERSFWVDFKLMLRTVAVVLSGQGN